MGLDSVELLVSFEEYFSITVSNSDAEKMYTVQDTTDVIASYKGISVETCELREIILNKINTFLKLDTNDFIFKRFMPSDKTFWRNLAKQTELKIPLPVWHNETESGIRKVFSLFQHQPDYDWSTITLERFVEVVCFENYKSLVDVTNLKSKYEIYVAISGITGHNTGLDLYEILPDKSFVNDFGIN